MSEKSDQANSEDAGFAKRTGKRRARLRGRPADYDPGYCHDIYNWMAKGYSITAAAGAMGFARSTVYGWRDRYPDFANAIELGKAARTLYHEVVVRTSPVASRVRASLFALSSAAPDEWREPRKAARSPKTG
jgi:hypothetical protein